MPPPGGAGPAPNPGNSELEELEHDRNMMTPRIEAINAQRHYGQGVARIARLERHGHTLWTAQLAGLSRTGARQTCSDRTVHRSSCLVIAPSADHLASLPADEAGRS